MDRYIDRYANLPYGYYWAIAEEGGPVKVYRWDGNMFQDDSDCWGHVWKVVGGPFTVPVVGPDHVSEEILRDAEKRRRDSGAAKVGDVFYGMDTAVVRSLGVVGLTRNYDPDTQRSTWVVTEVQPPQASEM